MNGTTTHQILYYLTAGQVGAILPSGTPVGTGQISVTNNGQTGPPAPIQVVQSAFGILTLNGLGTGAAAAFDVKNNYLGFTNSANPGDIVNLWGSGVGPAAGDETNLLTPVDLASIPIEVDIGGISVTVTYHGRSIYPGLDQIQVIVPANVQPGCWVSVVVRTGNIVSNFATIPVAAGGRACSEPALDITSDLLSRPSFTFGTVDLRKDLSTTPPTSVGGATTPGSTSITDSAKAQFLLIAPAQLGTADLQYSSIGSCIMFNGANNRPAAPIQGTQLDAGPAINLSGPNGKMTLNQSDDVGTYSGEIGGSTSSGTTLPTFIPTTGGTFNFDNGAGGSDVRSFTASITLGTPLVWSNEATITTVNRSNGVTVNWAGGLANRYVRISGTSFATSGGFTTIGAFFTCAAPVSANQFTVPSSVLLGLPPTGTGPGAYGTLSVGNYSNGQRFTALGLDVGSITAAVTSSTPVTYQ